MLYWDGTRHQNLEIYVLKNGPVKLAHIWKVEGHGWFFNLSDKATSKRKLIPNTGSASGCRLHVEKRVLHHLGLKVKPEQVKYSISNSKKIKIWDLMKESNDLETG